MREAEGVVHTWWWPRETCMRGGGRPSARAGEVVHGDDSDGSGDGSLGFAPSVLDGGGRRQVTGCSFMGVHFYSQSQPITETKKTFSPGC